MVTESIIDDWEEAEVPVRGVPAQNERQVPSWLQAERYFKRYRDTKKVIPLRAAGYGKVNS